MSPEQLAQLRDVNTQVNAIPYDAIPGPEEPADYWHAAVEAGMSYVCRDYTLLKSEKLQALGWPQSAMTVVLCNTEIVNGAREYHAVLAVDTGDEQSTILDSRFPDPYRMDQCPADYQWLSRQVAGTVEFEPIA
jgi:predicted transglutaminase-like cysteine proteinase